MDDKLKWCFSKKGVRLIEPNENLAREYLKSAEETLLVLKDIKERSNMWLATTKYYCEYFAVYALLMRLGIKSEIHDCTIEIIKFLEKESIIEKGIAKVLEHDKELRIDNQYYLKNKRVAVSYNSLRDLILKMKERINIITNEKVGEIREKIRKLVSEAFQ
ncbi:hypothetical protein DRZ77_03055 [Candidatus Woesearchaeota archaeon]|nr:hypothetical protein [Candidatus Woesearchaeota archaeon]RLE40092.1 MAG: hypothetical protein DRZ77_03055 [Candidatus Woesearchaeota archaeon]